MSDLVENPEERFSPQRLKLSPFIHLAGEGGEAVIVEKEKLSPEERKKYDDGWQNNAFNQYASDQISLHRGLKDVRDHE